MNHVSDIIGRKGISAIAVPPDTPVIDALQIMAEKILALCSSCTGASTWAL